MGDKAKAPPGSQGTPSPTGILPAHHWAQQTVPPAAAAGDQDDDADSAIGDDNASSTASITSSILAYRTIQGRSYHSEQGDAQYWGSNDEPQNEAMDINHHTLTLGIGSKLFLAPLDTEKIENVVDIGTGTGIWAIDFADEHPHIEVVGTDLSVIQPSWVPPNVTFEIEDCTREWTFRPNSMDYIHIRWLVGSIKDWDELMRQAYRVLKPGGWVESFEPSSVISSDDDTVEGDSAMGQWGKFFIEGGKKIGHSFTVYEDELQMKAIQAAGFVDIDEFQFKCPVGGWAKDPVLREMGRFTQHNMEADSEGFILFMAHTLGWTHEEIQVYIAHLRREMKSGKLHGSYKQRVVWGRKPE